MRTTGLPALSTFFFSRLIKEGFSYRTAKIKLSLSLCYIYHFKSAAADVIRKSLIRIIGRTRTAGGKQFPGVYRCRDRRENSRLEIKYQWPRERERERANYLHYRNDARKDAALSRFLLILTQFPGGAHNRRFRRSGSFPVNQKFSSHALVAVTLTSDKNPICRNREASSRAVKIIEAARGGIRNDCRRA